MYGLPIHDGKGRKDRDVVRSPHLLAELRQHYRRLASKPATWLFPGGCRHTDPCPTTGKVVWHAVAKPPRVPAFANRFIRIPRVTALPPICWSPAPTYAPFRFYSATPI